MTRLYNLLTSHDDFTQFETYAAQDPRNPNADSLESIHDAIHGITGGNGHMTFLDYSAFDPLFMLHHAMVDRVFAIWQALHPDSYVEPMRAVEQTYTTAMNTLLDGDSRKSLFVRSEILILMRAQPSSAAISFQQ
jgi:tyrosinase